MILIILSALDIQTKVLADISTAVSFSKQSHLLFIMSYLPYNQNVANFFEWKQEFGGI